LRVEPVPFAPSYLSRPAILASLLLAGCNAGDGLLLPGDGVPAAIRVVRGNDQSGRVGDTLADPLVARVTDSQGRVLQGVEVAFEFTDAGPGADIEPATGTTNASGEADARVRLGTRMGPQVGQVRVVVGEGAEEPKASFTVRALSENANGIAAVSGDNQSGPAGSVLANPLVVQVTDAFGNPISGVPIDWTAEGGGSVSQASVTTDDEGRASVQRTLGPTAGPQTTLATSEGLAGSPVTFTHTATAGNAAGLSIVSGNNQTAEVGTRLPADLVVRLVDGDGNPVPNTAVTWVVSTGEGSVTPENGMTDGAGRSSAQWTLGPNPGENRVDAVVSGVGFVTFTATGTRVGLAPTVTTITNDTPDPSIAGTAFAVHFQVTAQGVTPSGSVTVTVTDGTPTCTGTLQNGRGSCLLQLNQTGDRTLRAAYSGAPGLGASADNEPHRVVPRPSDNRTPDADYNWHCEGLTCQFTDASRDPDGDITSWSWDFGGTGSSRLEDPSHTFPGPGEYQVTLTVTDNGGATDQSTAGVEVEAPPPPPPGGTTTTITGDGPDPSDPGVRITVSFTVSASSGTPTGTVEVRDQNGGGCNGSVQSGSCSYTPNGFGTRTITATYKGNSNFTGSSDTEDHTVTTPPPPPGGTTTTITGDGPDPSDPGAAITVSFTVSASSGTPTGTVEVRDQNGGGCDGSAPSGSCSYVPNGFGTRTITATYQGGPNFTGSADTEDHTVTTPPAGTTTTITGDGPDPSDPGVPITVTFSVSSSAGTPTGTVQVRDQNGGGCDGSAPSGSCSYTPNGFGTRTIIATYQGSPSFTESADTEDHTVTTPPAGTTTTITNDLPDPSIQNVPFTVSFTVSSGSGTPGGDVTVSDGTDSCTGTLDGSGSGSCSLTLTTVGGRTLTATYPGNASFALSSDTEPHQVDAPPPPPNTAPSFNLKNSDLSANMGEARTEEGWAENISPGPSSESGQTVAFLVSANNLDLFSVPPAISPAGTLTFTTAGGEGDSVVSVQLQDNGGTANGGQDTSAEQTFTIHISGGGGG
jgi:PKD domain-containing protein/Big-like domain-containing protein